MLIALPLIVFIALMFLLRSTHSLQWRAAAVTAAVWWGAILVVLTESLSVPHAVTRTAIAWGWLVALLIISAIWRVSHKPPRSSHNQPYPHPYRGRTAEVFLPGGMILLIMGLIGTAALASAPNTFDAMEYHLPRVMAWMNNRGVQPFPTPDYAQLVHGPWAEYAMMHFTLLWGNDRLVGLVAWLGMAGSVVGVSAIAQTLGAGLPGQLLAALICGTIPQGVLQSSGTKNEYVLSFWIVALAWLLLRWNKEQSWLNTLSTGLAIGLAILTKGLAFTLIPAVLLFGLVWNPAVRMLWFRRAVLIAAVALLINAPQLFRNDQLTGSPLGQPVSENGVRMKFAVEGFSLKGLIANVLRNASLHLGTPSGKINNRVQEGIERAIRVSGSEPEDPRTTFRGFVVNGLTGHEGRAGNPLHFLLLTVALALICARPRLFSTSPGIARVYAMVLITGFLLISGLLKWNQWNSRYHLALFVLGSVVPAILMEKFTGPRMRTAAAAVLFVSALPYALFNQLRPLVFPIATYSPRTSILQRSRADMYFTDEHEFLRPTFVALANAVKATSCRNVGIDASFDLYVYPLFALLGADSSERSVQYAGVANPTRQYQRLGDPCAVICVDCRYVKHKWMQYSSTGGRATVINGAVIFSADGSIENRPPPGPWQDPRSSLEVLADIDEQAAAMAAVDISSVTDMVEHASHLAPALQRELKVKYGVVPSLEWRVIKLNESLEPNRRRVLAHHENPQDREVLLAADEAIEVWRMEVLPRELAQLRLGIAATQHQALTPTRYSAW